MVDVGPLWAVDLVPASLPLKIILTIKYSFWTLLTLCPRTHEELSICMHVCISDVSGQTISVKCCSHQYIMDTRLVENELLLFDNHDLVHTWNLHLSLHARSYKYHSGFWSFYRIPSQLTCPIHACFLVAAYIGANVLFD